MLPLPEMGNGHYANNMDEDLRKQIQDRRRMLHDRDPEWIAENVQDRRRTFQETQDPDKLRSLSETPRKTHKRGTFLLGFSIILLSSLMIYVGVRYRYCEGLFSWWLIIGGVLSPVVFIFVLLALRTSLYKLKCCYNFLFIFNSVIVLAIFIWWIFGFSRIMSGQHGQWSDIQNDGICQWYFFWIPVWITLLPWFIIAVVIFRLCVKYVCCDIDDD